MNRATVYMVTNAASGERYIGVTAKPVRTRWSQHKRRALNAPNTKFYYSLAKNGPAMFEVVELACVIDAKDGSYVERQVISDRKPEYNMTNGGEHTVGRRVSPDVVEKIRARNTGKKRTPEVRAEMSRARLEKLQNFPELLENTRSSIRKAISAIDHGKRLEGIRKATAEGRMFNNRTPEQQAKFRASSHSPQARAKRAAAKRKPVECVTLNAAFDSMLDAADATGIHFSNISMVCLGKRKSAGGMVFRYV